MCNNVETLYKRLTGVDPKKLEPPLAGQALIDAINRLRRNPKPLDLSTTSFKDVEIYERSAPSEEPFMVLTATLTDGSTIGCYVFKHPPEKKQLLEFAQNIPSDQWFTFDPKKPSDSGV